MKKHSSCILMSLLMITTAMAGCLEGDSEEVSIVGKWYMGGEDVAVEFTDDGTVVDEHGNVEGNWSVEGNVLTFTEGYDEASGTGAGVDSALFNFHISDGWLLVSESDSDDCSAFSDESIGNDTVFFEISSNLTLPSFCTTIWESVLNNPDDGPSVYYHVAEDHPSAITNGTNDTLMVLYWAQAPADLNWASLVIQLIDESGMPVTCSVPSGDDACRIVEHGVDDTSWETDETIFLKENDVDLCAVAPCSLTIKISDGNSGNQIGSSQVVVE